MFFCLLALIILFFYARRPIMTGSMTKQTVYLWLQNIFHLKDRHREATFMLIDDDSGVGIFKIHEICERVGVKATFAVVPAFLDRLRSDSLCIWHRDGYGIAVHGYDHGQWFEWTSEEIVADINKSIAFFEEHNIVQSNQIRIVVTPYSYDTQAIRKAIHNLNLKMVVEAGIINPDTSTFPWYRLFITQKTKLDEVRNILELTKENKGFIIFGTHSSDPDEFSAEKVDTVLRMAVKMAFIPYSY